MKRLIFISAIITFTFIPVTSNAQNCKPDYSKMDKIEKQQIDAWQSELFTTSFGKSLVGSSQIVIFFSIARMGDLNFVQLQLRKDEGSEKKALIESGLRGAKGNEFHFGLKDGPPLKFVATEVTNETKLNSFSNKWVTTVVLSSEVKNEDLQKVKDALTNKPIDATRILLENDLRLEETIKEKNGIKMMQKATCFFDFLAKKGLMKSEAGTGSTVAKFGSTPKTEEPGTITQVRETPGTKAGNENISADAVSDYSEQFEGNWTSDTKKNVTLIITKIDSKNFEVKQISKAGPLKKNTSPCPSFDFVNNELVCKQFKIIYLPESSSIYYDGHKYKKE